MKFNVELECKYYKLTNTILYVNKTGILRITQYWSAFAQPLLQWKDSTYYVFWVYVSSLRYPVRKERAPL